MKIAFLIHLDGPGGGPVALSHQVNYFKDRCEVVVLHGGRGRVAAECDAAGVPHVRIPTERLWKCLWAWIPLWRTLCAERPDGLIVNGQWGGMIAPWVGRLAKVPRIVYVAQWPAFYTDWDPVRVVRNRLCESLACGWSHYVVALCESVRYQYLYRRLVDDHRLVCIPNALNVDETDRESAAAFRGAHGWEEGESCCHVVSAGRLADQKRVDWLLRSWTIVQERVSGACLWIVGDGPEKENLERLSSTLGLKSCRFVGRAPTAVPWLAAADVAVVTSLYEGYGYAPLEAMASGTPVVASRVDGVRDSVRDGTDGFLVNPGDIEGFAEKIVRLARDKPLRERMGRAGRERAVQFAPERVLPALFRLMQ